MGRIVKRLPFFVGLRAFGAQAVRMLMVLLFFSILNSLRPYSSTFIHFHAKVPQSTQKYPKVPKSCQKMPKVATICQKLPQSVEELMES